jgi:uncharacterized protein YacL (UPF0231 family)
MSSIKLQEEVNQIVHETMSYYDSNNNGSLGTETIVELMEQYRNWLLKNLAEKASEA